MITGDVASKEPTSFIGRTGELTAIADHFGAGTRIVTLIGPAGVGKTRLAEEYCTRFSNSDALRFCVVPFETIARPELVLPAIASALGLRNVGQSPLLVSRIAVQFRDQQVVLLLDNFEHVVLAAPDIRTLIEEIPGLSILITSQRPLNIKHEHAIRVEPFDPPAGDDASVSAKIWNNSAVVLFADRARKKGAFIDPRSEADIVEIVRRLDGLPLAIELAAATMWQFSTPAQLLTKLDLMLPILDQGWRDGSPRHATMRAAVRWSYDLLDPQEQALLTRVSVFAGGFNLTLAELLANGRTAGGPYPHNDLFDASHFKIPTPANDPYLIGTDAGDYSLAVALAPLDGNVNDLLESLVDKFMLQRVIGKDGSARYRMLETMRAFGQEQLELSGAGEATRHAHAAMMMAFSEFSAHAVWRSRQDPAAMLRLDDELRNLQAALTWAESHGAAGAELVARTVQGIWQYFQFRGMLADVRDWLGTALTFSTIPPYARAFSLSWFGLVCWIQGDDIEASRAVEEALAIAERIDNRVLQARTLVPTAAAIAWRMGDFKEMQRCIDRALPTYLTGTDPFGAGICLFLQGQLLRVARNPGKAREVLDQAYDLIEPFGYGWGMATARYYAAEAMRDLGDFDESARLLIEALDLYWDDEDGWGGASVVSSAAVIAFARNDPERAARFFGIAATLLTRAGAFVPPSQMVEYTAIEAQVRTALNEDFEPVYQGGLTLNPRIGVAEVRAYLAGTPSENPAPAPAPKLDLPRLTPTQWKVVEKLHELKSVKVIAKELGVNPKSVYPHIRAACARWGVSTREELVRLAERSGLF